MFSLKHSLLVLSERRDMFALPLRAMGRWAGCSELPQEAGEEAAQGGANSDLCGGQSWRGRGGRVPAHTEAGQRLVSAICDEIHCENYFYFHFSIRDYKWFNFY